MHGVPTGLLGVENRDHSKLRARPFLRWAGGKQRLSPTIAQLVPPTEPTARYFEPFLGGGSVFFLLAPQRAVLSDANRFLMEAYGYVRSEPEMVAQHLQEHINRDSSEHYYTVRQQYNAGVSSVEQAARFIYLNHACYNGIFRVNAAGLFNVPYGSRKSLGVPAAQELARIASALQGAELRCCDYLEALQTASKGDTVYLDPPYPPLNGTAYFTHYTKERFSDRDQNEVAQEAHRLRDKGCIVTISNADTAFIRSLYASWNMHPFKVTRWITCRAQRHQVTELLITSYPLADTASVEE